MLNETKQIMRCSKCKREKSSKFYVNENTGKYNPKIRVCLKCRIERKKGKEAARSLCGYSDMYDRLKELHLDLYKSGHTKACKSCGEEKTFGHFSVGRAVCKPCRAKKAKGSS